MIAIIQEKSEVLEMLAARILVAENHLNKFYVVQHKLIQLRVLINRHICKLLLTCLDTELNGNVTLQLFSHLTQ